MQALPCLQNTIRAGACDNYSSIELPMFTLYCKQAQPALLSHSRARQQAQHLYLPTSTDK